MFATFTTAWLATIRFLTIYSLPSLVKTFMHDRLNISITGYDILQNISNHTYIVNGQGREETFYNNIPSYVMLTIGYRISKKP